MLLLSDQRDIGIGLTKSLKRNLDKHLPNNVKAQVKFTVQKLNTQFNLRIGPSLTANMMAFILVNVQNRTALIIILVNLLGESLSEL